MNKYVYLFLSIVLPCTSLYATTPSGNGTWVYDTRYNADGKKIGQSPGLFVDQINRYNLAAGLGHKINQVFSYGGDMEMYCQGAGESDVKETCTEKNMLVFYTNGKESTTAYDAGLNTSQKTVSIIPIVDGRLDQKGADDYLSPFNKMDEPTAKMYAYNVAKLYCQDDRVAGVQFDIEPFNINQPGQAYFFQHIARDFAGQYNPNPDGSDPLNCVNKTHPTGRFFSVFTFAGMVDGKVADVLNKYQNGYVIDSLYDVGPTPGGTFTKPDVYAEYVKQEVQTMLNKANQYNVKFQFAIPAAASAHEFESQAGKSMDVSQLDYVKAAFAAIDLYKARLNPNFLGIDIWSFNDKMLWGGQEYTPAEPSKDMKDYLRQTL